MAMTALSAGSAIKKMSLCRDTSGSRLTARPFCPLSSAEPHLDGDPNQVRMAFGAELLLEQGRNVGHGLVGNLQHIGDCDDLFAPAQ